MDKHISLFFSKNLILSLIYVLSFVKFSGFLLKMFIYDLLFNNFSLLLYLEICSFNSSSVFNKFDITLFIKGSLGLWKLLFIFSLLLLGSVFFVLYLFILFCSSFTFLIYALLLIFLGSKQHSSLFISFFANFCEKYWLYSLYFL